MKIFTVAAIGVVGWTALYLAVPIVIGIIGSLRGIW